MTVHYGGRGPGHLSRWLLMAGGSAAALALDFTTGALDSRITFTRASSGTYFDASGVLQLASTNSARFDYDPVTLQPRGLLIEEQRTNLLLRSEEFDNASWGKSIATITANYAVSPDGTADADRFVSAGGSFPQIAQSVTVSTGDHTVSIYVKSDGTSQIQQTLLFDGDRVNFTPTGTWTRITLTKNVTASGTKSVVIATNSASAAASSFLLWGAQLEAGPFATSYIPTAGSTVTRAADDASMTGTNFSSWYATDNTIVVEASSPASGTRIIWQADDGTANNRATLYTSGTSLKLDIVTGGVSQASLTLGTIFANTAFKAAFALKTNDVAASLNGAAQVTDASVTLPTVDRCRFGSDTTGNQLCEHIKSFTSYASRLADVQGLAA